MAILVVGIKFIHAQTNCESCIDDNRVVNFIDSKCYFCYDHYATCFFNIAPYCYAYQLCQVEVFVWCEPGPGNFFNYFWYGGCSKCAL